MPARNTTARQKRLVERVKDIVERFGPRPPGSQAERETAQYILDQLYRFDFDVRLQPVVVYGSQQLAIVIGYALVIVAAIVLANSPIVAASIAALGVAILLTEANGNPTVSRIFPKRNSSNVVAVKPSTQPPMYRLIFIAHLDTAQPSLFSSPRVAAIHRQSFMFSLNTAVIILVIAVLGSIAPLGNVWWVAFGAGLYLILHLAILLHGIMNMPPSPGANHDASGLAILLELAESIGPLQQTELWLVAVCGHEANGAGMREFLRRTSLKGSNSFIINVDGVGAGTINLTLIEGFLRSVSVSQRLLEAGALVVKETDLPVQAHPYQHELTESYIALREGIPAISIVGLGPRGVVTNWHWRTDTVENIVPSSLATAASLAEAMVLRIDKRAPLN